MVPTVEWMSKYFNKFNKQYFEGKLETPQFVVGCPYGCFGYLDYRANYNKLTRKISKVLSQPKLMLTSMYDRKQKDVLNTMLHEMIHLYIYSVLKKYPMSQHGSDFTKIANNLNSQGWNISETNELSKTDKYIDPNKQNAANQNGPTQNVQQNKNNIKGQNKKIVNSIIKLNGTLDTMLNNNYFKRKDTINTVNVLKNRLKKEVPQLTESYISKILNESINNIKHNNMGKKVRLTENDLHNVVKESVSKILSEMDYKTYLNAARKWARELEKNPSHPKRKSSIMGHENSKGNHDIHTDNRLRAFSDAARQAFNRDYGFNVHGRDNTKGSYGMSFDTDNIGSHGYYDSIGTETHVPGNKAVTGKTKDGKRTKTILKDRFHLDSVDGTDKYPSRRHETRIGFDNEYDPRNAVEPEMDRWDYMKARNIGNQDILDYANGKYEFANGKWGLKGDGYTIFHEDDAPKGSIRPPYCYAHGQLEDDLGFDIFSLDGSAKKDMLNKYSMKIGNYKCNFNGKPCTLYVGYSKNGGPSSPTGLACYDDDEEAINYIKGQLYLDN